MSRPTTPEQKDDARRRREAFAERFGARLDASGMTGTALAERVGASTQSVSAWRYGRSLPRDAALARLAAALDCDPAWLSAADVAPPPPPKPAAPPRAPAPARTPRRALPPAPAPAPRASPRAREPSLAWHADLAAREADHWVALLAAPDPAPVAAAARRGLDARLDRQRSGDDLAEAAVASALACVERGEGEDAARSLARALRFADVGRLARAEARREVEATPPVDAAGYAWADRVLATRRAYEAVRNRVVAENRALCYALTRRLARASGVDPDDLAAEAIAGLLRAVERYEPGHGTTLATYAQHWVRHAVDRNLGHYQDLRLPVNAVDDLTLVLRADEAGAAPALSDARVKRVREAHRVRRFARLDAPHAVRLVGGGDTAFTLGDMVADPGASPEEQAIAAEEAAALRAALARLPARRRRVLEARFGLDGPEQTLNEVGARMGVGRERARQIEVRALADLAAELGRSGGVDRGARPEGRRVRAPASDPIDALVDAVVRRREAA
jgi:RNA polymerase sigma factor (sigma-70 family)